MKSAFSVTQVFLLERQGDLRAAQRIQTAALVDANRNLVAAILAGHVPLDALPTPTHARGPGASAVLSAPLFTRAGSAGQARGVYHRGSKPPELAAAQVTG